MIYILRHGQTDFNLEGRFGGNPPLNQSGKRETEKLAPFFEGKVIHKIYCSRLLRSVQTGQIIQRYMPDSQLYKIDFLNEIDSGGYNSMTFKDFEINHNSDYLNRVKDKYSWNFPNGESYETAWIRIRKWITSVLQTEDEVIIIGHKGINRLIIGHYVNLDKKIIPYINIQQNIIIILNNIVIKQDFATF